MSRKLFCEISPLTYQISVEKCRIVRQIEDFKSGSKFAITKNEEKLPVNVYSHKSLIRRRLGNVNMELQENKAVNLSLASPKVTNVLIKPGETFSFWHLVGKTSAAAGYKEGLQISQDKITAGIGGGMCQFTNLIHWIVLHSPLTVTEHHHHDRFDLFPDFNRQVPFGTGTSIFYNYLDYRFRNDTDVLFQLITYTTEEYLCGELRSDRKMPYSYHINAENECFVREGEEVFRCGEVYRSTIDKKTGSLIQKELLRKNHARVMYSTEGLHILEQNE